MKEYTALIKNKKLNSFRNLSVISMSLIGLRDHVEKLYLQPSETLCALFPTEKLEK